MADSLSTGVVIPEHTDLITTQGDPTPGVRAMRTLGVTADAAVARTRQEAADGITGAVSRIATAESSLGARISSTDATSQARDDDLAEQIAGMEGMRYVGPWDSTTTYRINDVVTRGGDAWARLTAGSEGAPGDPEHWGLVAKQGDSGGFGELVETENVGLFTTVPMPSPPYDSGLRDVSDLLVAGTVSWTRLVRSGPVVDFYVNNWNGEGVPANEALLTLPPGFRPAWAQRITSSSSSGYGYVDRAGRLRYNGTVGTVVLSGTWITIDPAPATRPGIPA